MPKAASSIGVVAMIFVGSLGAGLWFLLWYRSGDVPAFVSRLEPSVSPLRGRQKRPQAPLRGDAPLSMAGSGTNLPLMRLLARRYAREHQARAGRLKVYDSIGSTGGVRAVLDGVVDVGLLSRPLRPKERGKGLQIVPYARVAVVWAVHPSVPLRGVSRQMLLSLYGGKKTRWRAQLPVVVLQRERGDSGHQAIARRFPAFRQVNEQAYRSHRWRVLYQDRAMQAALLSQEGAIGVFDLGAIIAQRLPLRVLSFAGVRPSVATLAAGQYPFEKTLSLALVGRSDRRALRFLRFLFSAQSQALMNASGYVPVPPPGWLGWNGARRRRSQP